MTRHNAGFWFADGLADKLGWVTRVETKFKGELAEGVVVNEKIRLLKPLTYMNLSGQSVAALVNFYKIPVERVLVVYDDMDFDEGVIRLKKGGSAGRHNGVQNIIENLGDKGFWRLRVGIGHPGDRAKVLGYVLGKPSEDNMMTVMQAIQRGLDCLDLLLAGDFQKIMNQLHADA